MGRILIVGEDRLAGLVARQIGSSLRASRARTTEEALVRALIERPEVVVCTESAAAEGVAAFASELRKGGLERTRLILICEDASAAPPARGFAVCTPDSLFESLAEYVAAPARNSRRRVEILANLHRPAHPETASSASFANVLEVGERELVIEAPLPLDAAERVGLGFFLEPPGSRRAWRVSFACAVQRMLDARRLQYLVAIEHADTAARDALRSFLAGGSPDPDREGEAD